MHRPGKVCRLDLYLLDLDLELYNIISIRDLAAAVRFCEGNGRGWQTDQSRERLQ